MARRWPPARWSLTRGAGSLERDGDSPEGPQSPRARRELARGGAKPSSEAEVSWRDACPSTRGALRPTVCWPVVTFWAMGLSLPWATAVQGVIYS
jgi:hypothetical protein